MNVKAESKIDTNFGIKVQSAVPKRRQDALKWNGWGYRDTYFYAKDGNIHFSSNRYPIGNVALPNFTKFVKEIFGISVDSAARQRLPAPTNDDYPPSNASEDVLEAFRRENIDFSVQVIDRLMRAHGQTLYDIHTIREGKFERIPDVVLWPKNHQQVVDVVKIANDNNLVVLPYGGGTAVSGAILCPGKEPRTILALDTSQMNAILWMDTENLTACCQSGIIGQDLERELQNVGFTTGHEPDSYEFSSLGGWVATRASGMKKNIYGNIEDLVVHVRMVTPSGVLEKGCQAPRVSCGPDFNHVILGSEGCLGVITEVVIKIRPLPPCKRYGSIVFPDFGSGVQCMREIARARIQPASVRLMDNEQFKFGQCLKETPTGISSLAESFKKLYVTKWKRFDVDKMSVMTLLFEGEKKSVAEHEKQINQIAAKYGGLVAGEVNGLRGYMLTFVIAYIRDLASDYNIVAESFETSVPWDRAQRLCENVKHTVRSECHKRRILHNFISCRVTQTYDAGCVIYFYFAFTYSNTEHPVRIYQEIEDLARDEIIASGGSISHHHGVGKLRKRWYPQTVGDVGVRLFQAIKKELDPNDVFAAGNLITSKL